MMNAQITRLVCIALLLWMSGRAAAQDEAGDLLGRINGLRASLGRAGYSVNGALAAAAQSQAQWIVETGSVSHTRPDGSGPRTRAAAAGYPSQQVSENIYGGTNAGVNDAWTFWVNSGIHYNSMVNVNYTEIGIGIARGTWGAAYVLVFGSPTGAWSAPASVANAVNNDGTGRNAAPANSAPPSFVLGLDERGNIMHQVQQGDTLGDIALIYGYGWDDIPDLMALNGMADVRDLLVGSVFLVPSRMGTFTPTADPNSPTASFTPSALPATITPFVAQRATSADIPTPIPTLDPTYEVVAFAPATIIVPPPNPTSAPTQIAALPTPISAALTPAAKAETPPLPAWLLIAIGVQALVVIGAGIEFARRLAQRPPTPRTPRTDYFTRKRR